MSYLMCWPRLSAHGYSKSRPLLKERGLSLDLQDRVVTMQTCGGRTQWLTRSWDGVAVPIKVRGR